MSLPEKPTTPAEMYEHFYVPAIFEPLSRLVLGAARIKPGERVLDLACGTGILARQAVAAVGERGRVVGVDLRPGMLAVAERLALPGARIEWKEGNAVALDLPDAAFDVVLCQQGLQFFPDRVQALREVKRVSRPGARVAFAVWRDFSMQEFFKALLEFELAHLGPLGFSHEDAAMPFSLGDAGEIRRIFGDAGLRDVTIDEAVVEAHFPAEDFIYKMEFAYAAVMPEFAEDPAKFDRFVEAITRDSAALCARYTKDGFVSFPVPTHLVTAVAA